MSLDMCHTGQDIVGLSVARVSANPDGEAVSAQGPELWKTLIEKMRLGTVFCWPVFITIKLFRMGLSGTLNILLH